MAVVDCYLDTDVVGGSHDGTNWANAWPTLAAAMADLPANFVTDTNAYVIHARGTTADARTTITKTTSLTYYLKIMSEIGDGKGRHLGKWSDSYYHIVNTGTASAIQIEAAVVWLDGLQVYNHTATAWAHGIGMAIAAQLDIFIGNCIVRNDAATGSQYGITEITSALAGSKIHIWNTIVQDFKASGNCGILPNAANSTWYVDNVTIYNADYPISVAAGVCRKVNVGAAVCTHSWGGSYERDTTCSTSTPTFVSTDSPYDLHLQSGDTTWKDAPGTDLSADADRPTTPDGDSTVITKDIDGQTRSGTWDIGADEYVSAITPLTTQLNDDINAYIVQEG